MFNRSNQRINYFAYKQRRVYQSNTYPFYFAYGRTALKIGLINYKIVSKKKVLVPEYICGEALQPFNDLKIDTIFYSVNEDLSPDWNALESYISTDVSAIMMVHFFGFPQQIEHFIDVANKYNLLLIEDNSHGYGGIYKTKFLGEFGHIGFSSPRKSFPILNGAILNSKKELLHPPIFPLEPVNINKLIFSDYIGRGLDHIIQLKKILLKKMKTGLIEKQTMGDWGIDASSFEYLTKLDLVKVRAKRNNTYQIWYEWCVNKNLKPIYKLNNRDLAPLAMPVIFKNKAKRDCCYAILLKQNIAVFLWPDLPEELTNQPNTGKRLFDKILCFPIHLGMDSEKLLNKIEKIKL